MREPRVVKMATNVCNGILSVGRDNRPGMLRVFEETGFKGYLKHYYKTLNDYRQFTKRIQSNTEMGDSSEESIIEFVEGKNYKVLTRGGEGDRMDMYFGVDLILYRDDIGYKTVQVKAFTPNHHEYDGANTDWFCVHNDDRGLYHITYDCKTQKPISI